MVGLIGSVVYGGEVGWGRLGRSGQWCGWLCGGEVGWVVGFIGSVVGLVYGGEVLICVVVRLVGVVMLVEVVRLVGVIWSVVRLVVRQ